MLLCSLDDTVLHGLVQQGVLLCRKREGGIREAAAAAARGDEVERSVQLSCGEHTDYGLLTLVNQDTHLTALQVKPTVG